ncbi:MAG: glycosyltransferase, partial [Mariprofundaceae bacterium]
RCFALLSHNEGMGRAVVEAFSASLPCVVSDVCGLSELVDDEVGRVVNADDAAEVAQALLFEWSFVTGENARARADHYSVEAMMNGLSEVYGEVCDDE